MREPFCQQVDVRDRIIMANRPGGDAFGRDFLRKGICAELFRPLSQRSAQVRIQVQ